MTVPWSEHDPIEDTYQWGVFLTILNENHDKCVATIKYIVVVKNIDLKIKENKKYGER
jgi:hypothetical protein